jgi:hypothetical protein
MNKKVDLVNAKEIDQLLVYLSLCEPASGCPDGKMFDGAFLYGDRNGIKDFPFGHKGTQELAAKIRRWEGRFVTFPDELGPEYGLGHCYTVPDSDKTLASAFRPAWKELQGARKMRLDHYEINQSGILRRCESMTFYRRDGKILVTPDLDAVECEAIQIFMGSMTVHLWGTENRWSVKVRLADGCPAIGFFTDPTGVKEFFRFRELPAGKSRRDALLHWVSDHWRQDRMDPDVEGYVREYLRGARTLVWHGMRVEIIIPSVDVDRANQAVVERQALRSVGRDRRPRDPMKLIRGR